MTTSPLIHRQLRSFVMLGFVLSLPTMKLFPALPDQISPRGGVVPPCGISKST